MRESTQKTLCIGLSLSPTWVSGSRLKQEPSLQETIFSAGYYIALSKRAEAAKLDFLFRPDALFLNIEKASQVPAFGGLDPSLLIAAIAHETDYIGFVSTISTLFYPPYIAARQLQSLNWLTQGRVGWNIVTALQGQKNFGQQTLPDPDERYKIASEFTAVTEALWKSHPLKQVNDETQQIISGLKEINFQGEYFNVQGPLNIPEYSQPIPYFQAGASPAGRNFAATLADGIFTATPDLDCAIEFYQDIQHRTVKAGRKHNAVKVLPGLSFYLADSREEAFRLFEQTHANTNPQIKFRYIESLINLDLSQLPLETIIKPEMLPEPIETPYSRTHAKLLRRYICKNHPSIKMLLSSPEVNGSSHWRVIGTADDLVDEIELWVKKQGCDGFIALPCGSEQSLYIFFDQVVPKLVDKGLFREDYQEKTLWQRLQNIGI
ncbi:NtaA/DmoA family FMN-dependent monooxygenase [Providencia sneebia]|uniref:Monooxygenase, NtaA/SnaA/SoxA family protein n=1 Tax=Providencia sneebia DSM 19967 TaxID=1141660 RepID=K8WHJ2_9GAMM|nr:NtaA/DmoA family FMN-dependent monooxygenase [Providencia sneebia]EKT59401.1 monooxygenase, NtaA/SnaA/SoxA family protein [Providencia sneebia DSM 19967]